MLDSDKFVKAIVGLLRIAVEEGYIAAFFNSEFEVDDNKYPDDPLAIRIEVGIDDERANWDLSLNRMVEDALETHAHDGESEEKLAILRDGFKALSKKIDAALTDSA